jgi:hypothetical protein
MQLITLEFIVSEEQTNDLLQDVEDLKDYWMDHAVRFQLFRDTANKSRFLGTFLTEKSVDEIVALIQMDAEAKSIFERLKESGVHILLSVMEEIV